MCNGGRDRHPRQQRVAFPNAQRGIGELELTSDRELPSEGNASGLGVAVRLPQILGARPHHGLADHEWEQVLLHLSGEGELLLVHARKGIDGDLAADETMRVGVYLSHRLAHPVPGHGSG